MVKLLDKLGVKENLKLGGKLLIADVIAGFLLYLLSALTGIALFTALMGLGNFASMSATALIWLLLSGLIYLYVRGAAIKFIFRGGLK